MNNNLIEALMYVKGSEGVSPKELKDVIGGSTEESRKSLKSFKDTFNDMKRGLQVVEFKDIFKLATRAEHKDMITKMVTIRKKQSLSQAALEVVGVIAYKQPVTKSQVNDIRGKSSEAVVNTLLVKGIIKEVGIAKTPGNPVQFGIDKKFYDYFNINSIKELPRLKEIEDIESEDDDDFELFSSQRTDNQ